MIKIIDNFFTERTYNDLLMQIACGPWGDEVNQVDGITYPHICKSIPATVSDECSDFASGAHLEFIRRSPEGVHCPNPIHHDASMGALSIMVYTSSIGGTAIMRHKKTGIMSAPESTTLTRLLANSSSEIDDWEIMEVAEARPNRAAIFDARLMYAALPFGGFGAGEQARTVYTRFVR